MAVPHALTLPATGDTASGWTRRSAAIVLLCFALNMVDGMDVLILAFIAPALQKAWGVDTAQLSIVFSTGLAGMAVGGLVLAPLADRFGRRRLILLAIALMAAAMLVSSTTGSVAAMAAARFVVGIGIGTVLACISALAAREAPPQHRNFAVGILQGGYPIGAMLTGFVTAWALPLVGWRLVIVATAAVSAAFLPLILLILPGHDVPGAGHAATRGSLREAIGGTLLRPTILLWATTICGFMALYFITSWITKLAIAAGLPEAQAIIASAIYNLGAFAGTLVMSLAANRIDVRRLCAVNLAGAAVVFLIFGGVTMPLPGVLAAAFAMGVTLQGGFNMVYPIAARVYPEQSRATGIGWAFGIGRIGAFTGPLLGGWALAAHLPLVAVFGIFCLPLTLAALSAARVNYRAA